MGDGRAHLDGPHDVVRGRHVPEVLDHVVVDGVDGRGGVRGVKQPDGEVSRG